MERKYKICVVEDNKDFREAIASIISLTKFYDLLGCFENAETAIQFISNSLPDVVLVDINLPGKNGIELVASLKQKHPQLHFLMCTSYDDDEKIFDSLKVGASGYILKSDGPIKIIEAITELFEGGSPMTSSIARKVVSSFSSINTSNNTTQSLTNREVEILSLLSKGLLNKEVADQLFISTGTVKKHIQNIYEKLHVNTRIEAVNKYLKR
ncbi:response regulator transcription factor [Flavobacterium sp.]|uniref:response regulator transcription factor n=1 Tax=Flavobacterium sp. TaxID=239 RepID=UPI00263080FB|nr:response regulator transcription factor [Flavobacterium sp.]